MAVGVVIVAEAFGGIRTYAERLLGALRDAGGVRTSVVWVDAGTTGLAAALRRAPADLVHVQYDLGLLPSDTGLWDLLCDVRVQTSRCVVVTLHSVYPDAGFVRRLHDCRLLVDRFVVHQDNARDFLVQQGIPAAQVHVVPHGTTLSGPPPPGRRFFGSERFRIAAAGFLRRSKGIPQTIAALVGRQDLEIVVAGMVCDPAVRLEIERLQAAARCPVTLIPRFLEEEELGALVAEADCVLEPYDHPYFASSGILHLAAGAGTPVLTSSSPKFQELARRIPFCEVWDGDYGARIDRLRQDPALVRGIRAELLRFAADTSWAIVAGRTRDLYEHTLRSPSPVAAWATVP